MDFLTFVYFVFCGVIPVIILIAGQWKTNEKAGWPGWWAIIPILNTYAIVKIANRPWWWLLLLWIPIVGFIVWVLMALDIARFFGRGVLFGLGLTFFPYLWFILTGFGPEEYRGLKRHEV